MSTIIFTCEADQKNELKAGLWNVFFTHYRDTVRPNTNAKYEDEGDSVYDERLQKLMQAELWRVTESENGVEVEFDITEDAGVSIAGEVYHTTMGYNDNGLAEVDWLLQKITNRFPGIPFEADIEICDKWTDEKHHYAYDGESLCVDGRNPDLLNTVWELYGAEGLSYEEIAEKTGLSEEEVADIIEGAEEFDEDEE